LEAERHRLVRAFQHHAGSENEFLLDRELQKSGKSYSGIPGGARPQDMAVTYSMGAIYNRSREHLGTTDQLIIRTRRRIINAGGRSRSTARRRRPSTSRSCTGSARAGRSCLATSIGGRHVEAA